MNFTCRICSCKEYGSISVVGEVTRYGCDNCGVVFIDPEKFSLPNIKFMKIHPDAKDPIKGKYRDSGHDIFSVEDAEILPHHTKVVNSGIAIELPDVYEVQLRPRSGNSKKGIKVDFGTIDWGYRGGLGISIYNGTDNVINIKKGGKLAQMVGKAALQFEFEQADKLSETERGSDGFGSTGD